MPKHFRGYDIPDEAFDNFHEIIRAFHDPQKADDDCLILTARKSDPHIPDSCRNCFCGNCLMSGDHKKEFADYICSDVCRDSVNGYDLDGIASESVPKLRPGMICEMADKDHTLVMYLADTDEGRHTGYTLQYFAVLDVITVGDVQDFSDRELLAVYADSALEDIGDPMVLEDLKKSLRLRDNPIWKKPIPVVPREMTVEQIESELGYKIKVVGNDKVQS